MNNILWSPRGSGVRIKNINYDRWLCIEAFGRSLPDLAAATRVWRDFFSSEEAVYKEGIKERRMVIGGAGGAGGRIGIGPRYGGYIVYENLILLCPGANLGQAIDRCKYLIIALKPHD